MGLSTWFLNFHNTKIQYTLMIFFKKQVFIKIRYTLVVLKKTQFFPIFWKKNRRPYFFKIIINWVPIISWCWNFHSNYEILCFIFEKKKAEIFNFPFRCKIWFFPKIFKNSIVFFCSKKINLHKVIDAWKKGIKHNIFKKWFKSRGGDGFITKIWKIFEFCSRIFIKILSFFFGQYVKFMWTWWW